MRILLHTVPVILTTAFLCQGLGAESSAELPAPLAEALRSDESGMVARIDWQALRSHPVVVAAVRLQQDDSPIPPSPASVAITRLLAMPDGGDLDLELVQEVWLTGRGMGSRVWLRAAGDGRAFEDELLRSGWNRNGGEAPSWVAPLGPEERQWIDDLEERVEDDAEREELLADVEANRKRVSAYGRGWYLAHNGWGGSAAPDGTGTPPFVDPGELPFPERALLEAGREAMVTFAIDWTDDRTREPPETSEEPTDRDRRAELQRQLDELRGSDQQMLARLGDIAASLSETDSGLVLDLTARRADGSGIAETERFLQMLVLAIRFGLAPTAPELDREIGDTVIEPGPDGVRLTARVSDVTLLDTLRSDAERHREAQRLLQELRELDQEAVEATAPD